VNWRWLKSRRLFIYMRPYSCIASREVAIVWGEKRSNSREFF
jgi:hypothetical protein